MLLSKRIFIALSALIAFAAMPTKDGCLAPPGSEATNEVKQADDEAASVMIVETNEASARRAS